MNKLGLTAIFIALLPVVFLFNEKPQEYRDWQPDDLTTYTPQYVSFDEEPSLENLQCPIPMKDRVRNHTGIQCVYSSTEMLGRWAEEPKLTNPPLTSRSNCKGYSGPSRLAQILNGLNVRFEQSSSNRDEGMKLIKKAMREGRGCLFGVPGHAMVLIHYDEKNDRVCWVDNSDRSLKVQTMTISRFKQRWRSWVCIIYADTDVIPYKLGNGPNLIPIRDMNGPQRQYPKNFVPLPRRAA